MHTRLIILILFLVIICVVNVIIYFRTKSLHKKYDAILEADENDTLEAKKYSGDEYVEAFQILKSLHESRKRAFKEGYVARYIGYIQRQLYDRSKANENN